MRTKRNRSARRVLDAYIDTLLAEPPRPAVHDLRELTLAQVTHGHEMICLWRKPLNNAQALCIELMLLAHIQKLSQSRLRDLLWLSVCRDHQTRSAHGR
ncbi:hypothetical protein [Reinekea sp.]|uniref:hypothetical protein n=1 Tax=Reinekea sp. TaxID=1970455 RepID=UPI0025803E85|nr:hypothetical protein [Reinekea sp.]